MKEKNVKRGYRVLTESEKRDDQLLDALRMVRGTKKHSLSRSND